MDNLYELRENINCELKAAKGGVPKSFYETYSSFSNTTGGCVYLGVVEKDGTIVEIIGVDYPEKLKKDILDTLNNRTKVSRNTLTDQSFEVLLCEGKKVLKVTIPEVDRGSKPIYLNDNITDSYKRNFEGDYRVSQDELVLMINDRFSGSKDLELNSYGYSFEDMNKNTFNTFRNVFNANNPNNIYLTLNDTDFASSIGIIKTDATGKMLLTNAAVLFFTDYLKIIRIYPNYFMDYQERILGSSRWSYRKVSDDLSWSGNVFDFFMDIFGRLSSGATGKFILENGVDISSSLFTNAIRETLVNALSNADFLRDNSIKVVKEADRITLVNTGRPLVSIEDMIRGGTTLPRNKEIIRYFRMLKYAERSGNGVPEIFASFKKLGFPPPAITEISERDQTQFLLLMTSMNESGGKIDLSKLISKIASYPNGVSQKDLMEYFGVSSKTMREALTALMLNGKIKTNNRNTKGKLYFINETIQ